MPLLIFIFFVALFTGQAMANHQKNIYGYIEKVVLVDRQLAIPAKLDTGAKSASLNARAMSEIEIDGKPYLRFTVPGKQGDHVFTCEYIGEVNIKLRAGESRIDPFSKKSIRRPGVRMTIQIGDQVRKVRVNLTNRKRFLYPLLLGREALIAFDGIVDPALKFTIKPKTVS